MALSGVFFKMKAVIKKRGFKPVFILLGGAAFSQLIAVAFLPLLTRLYTPEDFNVFAVFVSVVSVLSVAACLRFEIAIPLPEADREAVGLFLLSIIFTFLSALLLALSILALSLLDSSSFYGLLSEFLWFLPLAVLSLGLFSALQYWFGRQKLFQNVAGGRMVQALACISLQLGLGWFSFAAGGLIVGYLFGFFFGVVVLVVGVAVGKGSVLSALNIKFLFDVFRKYQHYPRYSVLESVANSAGTQVSIVLIAAFSAGPEAGFVMVAMKVLGVPISLLGGAVGQVYLSEAPRFARNGGLAVYTEKTVQKLISFGVGPLILLSILSPTLFPLVFGGAWVRAGELALWMLPWFTFQLVASPISMVMHVKKLQGSMLLLTSVGLLLRLGSVGAVVFLEIGNVTEIFAIVSAVFYIGCTGIFLVKAELEVFQIIKLLLGAAGVLIGWGGAGLLASLLLGAV